MNNRNDRSFLAPHGAGRSDSEPRIDCVWVNRFFAFLYLIVVWIKLKVLGSFKQDGFYPYHYSERVNEAVYWRNGLAVIRKLGK